MNPFVPPAAAATGETEIAKCILARCQSQLAGCLTDPRCVENLVCIKRCTGRPDEAQCEIRCGDLYDSASVQRFDTCALSEQKCVPTIPDSGAYPVPPPESLVTSFNTEEFDGRWYITAGLNPAFDTFPCQEHFFTPDGPGRFFAKINWRVAKNDGRFLTRSAIQRFVQDPEQPALLSNRNNEYLHYEDDWYILASEPDTYVLIYYRGNNDAWTGYGGAVLYTRASSVTPELEEAYLPAWKEAVQKVGLDWKRFEYTDNSCPPQPDDVIDLDVILDSPKDAIRILEKDVEKSISKLGKSVEVALNVDPSVLLKAEKAAEEEIRVVRQAIKDEFDTIRRLENDITKSLSFTERVAAFKDSRSLQSATKRLDDMERSLEGVPPPS